MPWRRLRRLTLRGQLLALLLPVVLAFSAAELWITRRDAVEAANAAYDRALFGAVKSLDGNISTQSGGLSVELPYRLFEFFHLTTNGPVYYRVATADGLVEIGSADLPLPPAPPQPGVPAFYDAAYFDESLRVVAFVRTLDRPLSQSKAQQVMIQVAEPSRSRELFIRGFVLRAAARDAVVLVVLATAIVALVTVTLRPVSRLAAQVGERQASDLSPLAARDLPPDIEPLVDAVNQQMQRTQEIVVRRRRFIDDASHQLRTPLTTLRTQLDYARRERDPERLAASLAALSAQLDHATRTTNQLLAMARSDTAELHIEGFELDALVRDVAIRLIPQAQARALDFGVQETSAAIPAQGDPMLLREAVTNLAHNAIRCSPSGGEVTLVAAADGFGYSVTVLDRGPGLDAELERRLGERFVRARAGGPSEGAGLGLAISCTIIERHRGRLQLGAREDGPGLRAALWWPRAGGQTSPA
jgi:two-component system sensor histidine kinase TctE